MKPDPFMLYAMECEGDIPTRRGQIIAAARQIGETARANGSIDIDIEVDPNEFTEDELDLLIQEIERYV